MRGKKKDVKIIALQRADQSYTMCYKPYRRSNKSYHQFADKYQEKWKDKYDAEAEGMGIKRIHKCINVYTVMVKDTEQIHAIQLEIN